MGAGPRELATHAIVETSLLAIAGGLLGLPVAYALVRGLLAMVPTQIPRVDQVAIDGTVLAFVFTLMLGCSVLCSLLPVWRLRRTDPADALKEGAHTMTDGPGWSRLRSGLVGTQVGLATALLLVAGLLLASFVGLAAVDPGFQPDGRVAVDFNLPASRYSDARDRVRFVEQLLANVQSLASIRSAAVVQKLPLEGEATVDAFVLDQDLPEDVSLQSLGNHYFASPTYFTTMGIAVVAGRSFSESDRKRRVALVSEHTARILWPGESGLGKTFWRSSRQPAPWEVIGVVADMHSAGLDDTPGLVAYVPYWDRTAPELSLVVHSRTSVQATAADLRHAAQRIDPELPLMDLRTLEDVIGRTVETQRFQMALTLAFAGAALTIACLGIYGVVSAGVQRRRGELAIRMALGGSTYGVLLLVAAQGMRPVVAGLALGMTAAVAGGSALQAMLFGVTPDEPVVLTAIALLVVVVGGLACVGPALRAVRTPVVAAFRQ
jgi:predicted permease